MDVIIKTNQVIKKKIFSSE